MFRHFLTGIFKNLWRHKLHSLIHIASLAIGLTVFAFAFIYVKHEVSVNRSWPNAEGIHRLVIEQKGIPGSADGTFTSVVARAYPIFTDYFSNEIDQVTRLYSTGVQPKDSDTPSFLQLAFVDPAFSDIFQLEVLEGNLDQVLQQPGFIAISESTAESLGDKGVIGSSLDLTVFNVGGGEQRYEIGAIYRLPDNISNAVRFASLTCIGDYSLTLLGESRQYASWENSVQVWLTLRDGLDTESFNAMQPRYMREAVTVFDEVLGEGRNIEDHLFYTWQPVTDMHFNPVDFESLNGDPLRVATFAVIGVLVLLVGCSNAISLSLAAVIERRREIGIRKASGAMPADVAVHYLCESILLSLIALVPAIAALELLRPAFQTLLPFSVTLETTFTDYLWLVIIAMFVGLINGSYPALLLSRVRPQVVLKTGAADGAKSGQRLRSLLVAAQFCLASMLLISTAALFTQLDVTRRQPLGFSMDNLILLIPQEQQSNGAALLNAFKTVPGITGVVYTANPPLTNMPLSVNTSNLVRYQGDPEDIKVKSEYVGEGFFELLEIPLLAGRLFDSRLDTADRENQLQNSDENSLPEVRLVVNRETTKALGFSNPEAAVNARIYQRYSSNQPGKVEINEIPSVIVGVVEDSQVQSIQRRPPPEIYRFLSGDDHFNLILKYEDSVEGTIQASLRQVFESLVGTSAQLNIRFLEPQLEASFLQERNESRLLLISAALAIFMSAIGLYGLTAFTLERGIKEVGVRKALGASISSIMQLYLWRFSRPIVLANLMAWPVATYFVLRWVQRFPYQMDKAWLLPICVGASLLVLLIALMTVAGLIVKAASQKPVLALRDE